MFTVIDYNDKASRTTFQMKKKRQITRHTEPLLSIFWTYIRYQLNFFFCSSQHTNRKIKESKRWFIYEKKPQTNFVTNRLELSHLSKKNATKITNWWLQPGPRKAYCLRVSLLCRLWFFIWFWWILFFYSAGRNSLGNSEKNTAILSWQKD